MGNDRSESEKTAAGNAAGKSDSQLKSGKTKAADKSGKPVAVKQNKGKLGSNRGVETMFRNAARANYQLMAFADNKASIMITVNGFILSVLMASIASTYNQAPWLMPPFISLILTSIASIFYAVLAAYPRVPDKKVSLQDVREMKPNSNILFFGTSANMSVDDYCLATEEMLRDQNFLYRAMAMDNHAISKMLLRKFKMLSLAYRAFLLGLGTSLLLAVVSILMKI